MPVHFPYPEMGWSTGNMRKAKMDFRDPSRGFRELEGEKKKRQETKASDAGTILGTGGQQTAQGGVSEERRQQLQYEMEAGYESKITPDEFEAFNQVLKDWKALPEEERTRRRQWYQDQEKQQEQMWQMSPNQLRQQGVTPGTQ